MTDFITGNKKQARTSNNKKEQPIDFQEDKKEFYKFIINHNREFYYALGGVGFMALCFVGFSVFSPDPNRMNPLYTPFFSLMSGIAGYIAGSHQRKDK